MQNAKFIINALESYITWFHGLEVFEEDLTSLKRKQHIYQHWRLGNCRTWANRQSLGVIKAPAFVHMSYLQVDSDIATYTTSGLVIKLRQAYNELREMCSLKMK